MQCRRRWCGSGVDSLAGWDGGGMIPLAKRIIPSRFYAALCRFREWATRYRVESYSQYGEDVILRILFGNVRQGFYVDVGAFHPMRFSNTYYFYKRGWHGINIDAAPRAVDALRKHRPRDISVEAAIANQQRDMTLYLFNEAAVNTLSPALVEQQRTQEGREAVSTKTVRTRTLAELLDQHKPAGQEIDLLSVDVEGFDLEVLQSNGWNRNVPKVVACEDLALDRLEDVARSEVYNFLRGQGYALYSTCYRTLIFSHESFRPEVGK